MVRRKDALIYARGLFGAQGSQTEVQLREEQLSLLAHLIKTHKSFLPVLGCPELDIQRKLQFVEKAFNMPFDPLFRNFLQLVFKNSKTQLLPQIAMAYHKLVINQLNEIDVTALSADPFSKELAERLEAKSSQKLQQKAHLRIEEKPALLAGFQLLIGNKLLDLSLAGKLNKLHKQVSDEIESR